MKVRNFSVTQVKDFRRCPRYWYDKNVLKKIFPKSEGLTRGDELHVSVEHKLKTGVYLINKVDSDVNFGEYTVYVDALRPHFAPAEEPVFVEHWMRLPTRQGPVFLGKIDYVRHTLELPRLIDWKSTSDPRWMLTPEQVRLDLQTNIYAHYLFKEMIETEVIEAGLVYVVLGPKGKPPKDVKKVKVIPVLVRIRREEAKKVWDEVQSDLDKMMLLAEEEPHRDHVPAKITACGDYGGCPSRVDCGITPLVGLGNKSKNQKKESVMGLRDRLKGGGNGVKTEEEKLAKPAKVEAKEPKQEKQVAKQEEEQPARGEGKFVDRMRNKKVQGAPVPGQIVPNDAPARTSGGADPMPEDEVEESKVKADEGDEPKRGRGRPKGTKKAPGFVIYVDCLPVKGGEDVTYAEDWWGSIEMKLNEEAAEQKLPHWMMLPFAEQKAAIALVIQKRVEDGGLPPRMLVTSSSGTISRDVLPLLIPHATEVVKALRG